MSERHFFAIAIVVAISVSLGCTAEDTDKPVAAIDFMIVPGERVGPVTIEASEADLIARLGSDRVRSADVEIGEGLYCAGAEIVFDDSNSLKLTWVDGAARARVNDIDVFGPKWRTAEGVGPMNSLVDLEQLNGKPFRLVGFGWDYGGTILSWDNGALSESLPQQSAESRVIIRLAAASEVTAQMSSDELNQVSGDREFSSAHPVMQKLNPKIYQLIVDFRANERCQEFYPGKPGVSEYSGEGDVK